MDKKTVNLYITSSVRGGRRRPGRYLYILETDTAAGPYTVTDKKELEETTANQSTLIALYAALKRIKVPCSLEIWLECTYVARAIQDNWAEYWRYSGWLTKRGEPVKDADIWGKVLYLQDFHDIRIHLNEPHSYQEYMHREVDRPGALYVEEKG